MTSHHILPDELPSGIVSLGTLHSTPTAQRILDPEDVELGLRRHAGGDWGNLSDDDWIANDHALEEDARILSAYQDKNGTPFWIVTAGDRSRTTVVLPEDY